ncbi:MAG: putative toxin-antitoxin system toxin component, PIN family [Candidatus Omnitrophota bacterium]
MKIFFDTNVIISSVITRGLSFDIIKDAAYKHQIYYTGHLLKEIEETLLAKFSLSDSVVRRVVSLIEKYFLEGQTSGKIEKVCRDSDDDQVLADAVANEIDVIVTGDKDLLILAEYRGIKIILPKDYWKL